MAPESNESQNRKLSLDDDAQAGLGPFEPHAKEKRARKQGAGSSRAGACTDPGGRLRCCLRHRLLFKKIAHLQQPECSSCSQQHVALGIAGGGCTGN